MKEPIFLAIILFGLCDGENSRGRRLLNFEIYAKMAVRWTSGSDSFPKYISLSFAFSAAVGVIYLDASPARTALPAAQFERNDTTIICETVH
jgi:hypothetical protein